ncbi:hypothetical protein [Mangrovimonas aestuarii]|uniref:hypothetical protein n=1 Tax=Mangrovimonas aestuarii TaxID=3018443 RepID=UPI002379AC52|nr:hypothetical protein [Mangrovimonas aestuarii]
MKKYILAALALVLTLSCSNNDDIVKPPQELIKGNWVEFLPYSPVSCEMNTLNFFNDEVTMKTMTRSNPCTYENTTYSYGLENSTLTFYETYENGEIGVIQQFHVAELGEQLLTFYPISQPNTSEEKGEFIYLKE